LGTRVCARDPRGSHVSATLGGGFGLGPDASPGFGSTVLHILVGAVQPTQLVAGRGLNPSVNQLGRVPRLDVGQLGSLSRM
jgi:hypothetical protein